MINRNWCQEILKDYDVVLNIGFDWCIGRKHYLFISSEKEAINLVNEMMQGTMNINELDDMAISAIEEFGNMISGAIATHLEQYGYSIKVTPPSVMRGKIVKVNVRGTILLFPFMFQEIMKWIFTLFTKKRDKYLF